MTSFSDMGESFFLSLFQSQSPSTLSLSSFLFLTFKSSLLRISYHKFYLSPTSDRLRTKDQSARPPSTVTPSNKSRRIAKATRLAASVHQPSSCVRRKIKKKEEEARGAQCGRQQEWGSSADLYSFIFLLCFIIVSNTRRAFAFKSRTILVPISRAAQAHVSRRSVTLFTLP